MRKKNDLAPSYSVTRAARRQLQRFDLSLESLGIRFAVQHQRELKRLHTFLPGDRSELDYSKYGVFLRPNEAWDEGLLFQLGLGVDHYSTAIKGHTLTAQPTAISSVRLYKNCVLPPRLWLRENLLPEFGDKLDVCGIDRLVAVDNGRDFRSNAMVRLFMTLGVIMLIVPPKRGDLKGTVERTLRSLEQMFFEVLPSYVPNVYPFTDPRSKWLRDKAGRSCPTVAEFEEQVVGAIHAYNLQDHPVLKKPRIVVYREGLASAPPLLPVGQAQIDALFAIPYEAQVTREGVRAETWNYNSSELHEYCRVGGPKVTVCVPVDDVRTAMVFHPELVEPLRVPLTTHRFDGPTPLELAKLVLSGSEDAVTRAAWETESRSALDEVLNRMIELQSTGRKRQRGTPDHLATTAAYQASHAPPVDPPRPRAADDRELAEIFGDEA
jgi:hypothetical protein